jgi:predicted TIM-barrel fold metal-dependent hydrolase
MNVAPSKQQSTGSTDRSGNLPATPSGWDCHVHVFDAAASVKPGHYVPAHRPLHDIEALAAAHGVGHLVLVQPSVYGTDNSVMLQALEASHGRHRGVAVIDPSATDAALDRLHQAGVRGIRFNLVSPAGHAGDVGAEVLALAPRLAERGWHVQWYAHPEHLTSIATWQQQTGLTFVMDHLAGLHAGLNADAVAWRAVEALAAHGAWVKLSGWYRLQAKAPYTTLLPTMQRVCALFGRHTVWGSDWPHTSFASDQTPSYASTLGPLHATMQGLALDAAMREHPLVLYGLKPSAPPRP